MAAESFEISFKLRSALAVAPRSDEARNNVSVAAEQQVGKLPRIAQVLALAIYFQEMVRTGEGRDYADLARLGGLSRERVSQIMKLRWLAPDLQVEILRLPRTPNGRFSICETTLRRIAEQPSWAEQWRLWQAC
ncbi:MAG TPA: hypothetical protein VM120_24815 [Bryobacteraceae bacterium]|nr:hypothetical protein [Bryobacteraceae bacterium]